MLTVNKLRKYRFNLIEVVLAIVILSLGMASVFVLFPAGLSNHRTAMAENSIADMAELVISRVRAEAALKAEAGGFGSLTFKKLDDFEAEPEFDFDASGSDPWTFKDCGKDTPSDAGYYFVRQLSGPTGNQYVDFAAVARVYLDENFENELFVPFSVSGDVRYVKDCDLSGSDTDQIRTLALNDMILPLVIEISYPADRPYADREKAYFRFEIFNEMYEVKTSD